MFCSPLQALPFSVLALAAPSLAEGGGACRLALVLALDVSGSVDAAEYRLQREGLASALLAPEVMRAALAGDAIALYAFEWAGASTQEALLPGWEVIHSEEDLARVADLLRRAPRTGYRSIEGGTALGAALAHAAGVLAAGPTCRERTVDVAGDGVSNDGIEPQAVIGAAYEDVTVNALIIDTHYDDPMLDARFGENRELVGWFLAAVLHGPGAFHILADGYEDYERAMTAKLLRELEASRISGWPVAGSGA